MHGCNVCTDGIDEFVPSVPVPVLPRVGDMVLHGPPDPAHLSELDHRLQQKLCQKLPMGKLSKTMDGHPMLPHGGHLCNPKGHLGTKYLQSAGS